MARPISEVMDTIRTAVNTDNKDTIAQSIDAAQEEILRMIPTGDALGRGASGYPLEYEQTFQQFAPGSAAPLSPGLVSGALQGFSATGQPKAEGDTDDGLPPGFQNGNIPDPAATATDTQGAPDPKAAARAKAKADVQAAQDAQAKADADQKAADEAKALADADQNLSN